jgi:hypothetical protein
MFEYLLASINPVIDGLEDYEKIYALDQAQYIPLRTIPAMTPMEDLPPFLRVIPGSVGQSAITRWELTKEQREAIANGADILLEVTHFGGPLAPVRVMVTDQSGDNFKEWFCAHTRGPYLVDLHRRLTLGEESGNSTSCG